MIAFIPTMLAIIVGIVESDMIGVSLLIALILAWPHMLYEANKYKGLTQSAALWHWQCFTIWIIYALIRLLSGKKNKDKSSGIDFTSQIKFSNNSLLYVATILAIIVIINNILDLIGIYQWYVNKNQVIIRHNYILERYHKRGEILDKTENEEWIMRNGIYLKPVEHGSEQA